MAGIKLTAAFMLMFWSNYQTLLAAATLSCPHGWQQWKGSCYVLLAEKYNWSAAKDHCERLGGRSYLAVPDSQEENDFIWEMLKQRTGGNVYEEVWIGCNDLRQKEAWECFAEDAAQEPRFTKWSGNEPTNTYSQRCVRISTNFGNWGNNACEDQKYIACEMRVVAQPAFCLTVGPDGRVGTT